MVIRLSRSRRVHRRSAFSLLELVLVLVVFGLLAFVTVPSYQKTVDRTTVKVDEMSLAAVARETGVLTGADYGPVTMGSFASSLEDCNQCTLASAVPGVSAAPGAPWRLVGYDHPDDAPTGVIVDPAEPSSTQAATYGFVLGDGWGTSETNLVMASRVPGWFVHAKITGFGRMVSTWFDQNPLPSGIPGVPPPLEILAPGDVLPPEALPPGITEIAVPDEHDPALETILDAGPTASDPSAIGGITSMVSSVSGYSHRQLLTDTPSGSVIMVKQTGPTPDLAVGTTFVTGIPGAKAITVGPSPVVPGGSGRLVLFDLFVGSSANGGSIVRVDAQTRALTTVVSGLGAAPSALAGYACYTPGSSSKSSGTCLYAGVGDVVHKVELGTTSSSSVWATLPFGFAVRGLHLTSGPAMMVAGATSTVTVLTTEANGATQVSGTPVAGAPNGGGLTYVGANSAASHQGLWAAGSAGLSQIGGANTETLAGMLHTHYHGQANWLYGATATSLWWFDLSSGSQFQLWPPPVVSTAACGGYFSAGGAKNLSLAACDIQAGDLVIVSLSLTATGSGACGGPGASVVSAEGTLLGVSNRNVGSCRDTLVSFRSLVADMSTQAAGYSYNTTTPATTNYGRVDLFVFRGRTAVGGSSFRTLSGGGSSTLAGSNVTLFTHGRAASGTVGTPTIAGATVLRTTAQSALIVSGSSSVPFSTGSGYQSSIIMRLLR